jgi:hypothetical protein
MLFFEIDPFLVFDSGKETCETIEASIFDGQEAL